MPQNQSKRKIQYCLSDGHLKDNWQIKERTFQASGLAHREYHVTHHNNKQLEFIPNLDKVRNQKAFN